MSSAEKSRVRKPLGYIKEKAAIEGFISCGEEEVEAVEVEPEKVKSLT